LEEKTKKKRKGNERKIQIAYMIIQYTLYRIYDVFKTWRPRELLNPKLGWFRARVIHMPRHCVLVCLSIHDSHVRLAVYYFEEEQREYTREHRSREEEEGVCG